MGIAFHTFRVIDSHTGGEPTRTIVDHALELHGDSIHTRFDEIRTRYDHYRRAIVNEPRGSEVMVGAHLLPPVDPSHVASVVFFNNVGYLGMCGHGMIGVVETLRYLGRIDFGIHTFETIAGVVEAELRSDGRVRITNVSSFREVQGLSLQTRSFGTFTGDIAYGGNWFFLTQADVMQQKDAPKQLLLDLACELLVACRAVLPKVDHVELFGSAFAPNANSRNFVLCPGGMYDRSPCGTGTSAKVACLAADGELDENAIWIQEGITGSCFEASYLWEDRGQKRIQPTIIGNAYVNGDLRVVIDERDPFGWGFPGMNSL